MTINDRKLLALLDYVNHEINCDGEELNVYVKATFLYDHYTEVHLEFIPDGLLPSGSYKLLSKFCLTSKGEGCTIVCSHYTNGHDVLHGVTIRIPEALPSHYELYEKAYDEAIHIERENDDYEDPDDDLMRAIKKDDPDELARALCDHLKNGCDEDDI